MVPTHKLHPTMALRVGLEDLRHALARLPQDSADLTAIHAALDRIRFIETNVRLTLATMSQAAPRAPSFTALNSAPSQITLPIVLSVPREYPCRNVHTLIATLRGNSQRHIYHNTKIAPLTQRVATIQMATSLEGEAARALGSLYQPVPTSKDAYDGPNNWSGPVGNRVQSPGPQAITLTPIDLTDAC